MAAWESMSDDQYDAQESYGEHVSAQAFYDMTLAELDASITTASMLCDGIKELDRDEWPVHQPGPAYDAPIPGVHWYGGCEPGYPRVNPTTGVCEGCGETACRECGRQNCPDHDAEALAAAGLREAFAEINEILDRAAAA